jgi:hypothetical protein
VELLSANSPHQIPGEEFFYEHVHLNFQGNYLLARAFAEQIESAWPALGSLPGPGGDVGAPAATAVHSATRAPRAR